MIPPKLKAGDEVRVISPATSLHVITQEQRCLATKRLAELGLTVTFSEHAEECDAFSSSSVESRVGYAVLREGEATGKIVGGNLCTLNLLQGTPYMPSLEGAVVLVEDDNYSNPHIFDRDLQSLLHQPDFDKVKALLIGRFQKASNVSEAALEQIVRTKRELDHLPVVANVNFGHVSPIFTFPIGGTITVKAENGHVALQLHDH